MTISECVQIVFQEYAKKLSSSRGDYSMFAEELRRMQNYDSEICPERWKPAIEYLKQHGWDSSELLKRFGERQFKFGSISELERLIKIYNFAMKNDAKYGLDGKAHAKVGILLEDYGLEKEDIDKLRKKNKIKGAFKYESNKEGRFYMFTGKGEIFTIDDTVKGFSMLFCSRDAYKKYEAYLFGVPKELNLRLEKLFNTTIEKPRVFLIGQVDINELATIGNRRFMYIFGMQPAARKDIIETLVELNKFPAPDSGKGYDRVLYSLKEEKDMSKLGPPKAVSLIYDEALAAKEQGLFADVKVYKLVREKKKIKKDPVIVGFDHFGNMHPLIYWTGDSKNSKKGK